MGKNVRRIKQTKSPRTEGAGSGSGQERKRKLKRVRVKIKEERPGLLKEAMNETRGEIEKNVQRAIAREMKSIGASTGTGEKIKTSFYLDHSLIARAKSQARDMGISMNAYMSLALYDRLTKTVKVNLDGRQMAETIVDHPGWVPFRRKPPTTDPLEKFGPGFSLPGEDGDPPAFATWDQCAAYARRVRDNIDRGIDEDWTTTGHMVGLTVDQTRAADVAIGTDEFDAYMTARLAHEG